MHKKLKLYIVGKEMLDRMSTALCSSVIDFWIVLAGVFWIACEATLQLLRDNKDSLMNPGRLFFLHGPLVEWEDEKRKLVSESVSLPVSYRHLF